MDVWMDVLIDWSQIVFNMHYNVVVWATEGFVSAVFETEHSTHVTTLKTLNVDLTHVKCSGTALFLCVTDEDIPWQILPNNYPTEN